MDLSEALVQVVDEGLGNSAYLLGLGDGRALAVDASLDLRAVYAAAAKRGLRIAYAAETHLHADFLSGARQLAVDHDARLLASAAGARTFDHVRLADGDEVDLGGLTLRTLATPGHTPEHLSLLVLDGDREVGVFTGGSLIVGAAARTDLVDAARTEELARAQYRSLHRLAALPDATAVWPTHGTGSFCSAPPGDDRTSTIGAEKATNPLLVAPDEDTFAARLFASLGSYPAYFDRLAELNRHGPLVAGTPGLTGLDAAAVRRLLADGALVLDVRPVADYARGHLSGSVSVHLRAAFATWLGWLVSPDVPLVIVRNPDQDPDDILWPALKVGYPAIAGELVGGTTAWVAAGGRLSATRLVQPARLDTAIVIDVRQLSEYAAGHVPGSRLIELGDLAGHADDLPAGPASVMCGRGERAATAAEADRAEVAAFLHRANLTHLVDVHTHFMPERMLAKVWAYFDGAGPLVGGGWSIAYRQPEQQRLEILRGFGVRAFTSMLYPHKPDMARWLNDWAAGFAGRTPDCLHTATFFAEPTASDDVRRALHQGARVFKCHLQVGRFDPNDPLLRDVWGLLAEAGVPVVTHCGSGPVPGAYTGPGPIADLLARHPRLPLIIAHLGMPEYREFLDLAERYDRVMLDTTMAFTDFAEASTPFPPAELARLADLGDRVLFGSDFPNMPHRYGHALRVLEQTSLGTSWLRAVCHDNAARLFSLGDSANGAGRAQAGPVR
jgi:glyoxylase-like metal-dependent hydrolase (beta-lactamase superfamily II)/rhodanese-related sulfurtransferase